MIEKNCFVCGKTFLRKISESTSKSGKLFCSKICFYKAVKIHRIRVGRKIIKNPKKATGNSRARSWFPDAQCEICGKQKAQRHHKDGNPLNNNPTNISMLCPKHHVYADRIDILRKIALLGGLSSVKEAKRDIYGKFINRG